MIRMHSPEATEGAKASLWNYTLHGMPSTKDTAGCLRREQMLVRSAPVHD